MYLLYKYIIFKANAFVNRVLENLSLLIKQKKPHNLYGFHEFYFEILRNNGLLSINFLCVTLWHMSIGARVIRAVALQQINHAPHAKASAESNNEGL